MFSQVLLVLEEHFAKLSTKAVVALLQKISLYCAGPVSRRVAGTFDTLVSQICAHLLSPDQQKPPNPREPSVGGSL